MKTPILATYGTNDTLAEITDADILQLDILYLAFGRVIDEVFSIAELTNIDRVKYIKSVNPELKILLSLRSDDSTQLQDAVADPIRLQTLCDQMRDVVLLHNLDGIDVDWEFPACTGIKRETKDHTELLRVLRQTLDNINNGKKYLVTIAAGTTQWYLGLTELDISHKYLDYINLMTYDMNWVCKYTVHHACTYKMDTTVTSGGSIEESLEVLEKGGVPLDKIIIGGAFYGRKWNGVKSDSTGLFVLTDMQSDYAPGYTELKNNYVNKNGYTRYFDKKAGAPYLYNGDTFISYDDIESLDIKCKLVNERKLAGIMSWQYSADSEHELITAMNKSLKG